MTFLNDLQEFDTPGEALAHHGVKGMKWGVRRTAGTREFKAANPTASDRRKAIKTARAKQRSLHFKEDLAKTSAEKQALKNVRLTNPDRATALRLTRGEKIIGSLIVGIGTPSGILPTAVAATTAYRVVKRRQLEP